MREQRTQGVRLRNPVPFGGLWRGGGPYPADIHQEVLEELPHVVGGVDLLHLHLRVHVAVVQEVDVGDLHLEQSEVVNSDLFLSESATFRRGSDVFP